MKTTAAIQDLALTISKLSRTQIDELLITLEGKHGISMNIYPLPMADSPFNDQMKFKVILKRTGRSKLQVVKHIKEIFGLGLREAKEIADEVPSILIEDAPREYADELKEIFEDIGATIEIK